MGIRVSQGGTLHEVDADTTLSVDGTIDLTNATVTVPAGAIDSTGLFSTVDLDVTGVSKVDGVIQAVTVSYSVAAGGANVCEVTITLKDGAGATVAAVHNFDVWLSDASSGAGLTGTTASGTVTVKSASGAVVGTYTAKKALRVQSLATGVFILEITDTAKTGFYVCVASPVSGRAVVSSQLVAGNYG